MENYNLPKWYLYLCVSICFLKNFSKLLKRRKMIWTKHLERNANFTEGCIGINYCSVMQRFLNVTFSYQPKNYFEFKSWIKIKILKSKIKINVILMELINLSKTIILANKISKSLSFIKLFLF